MSKEKTIDEEYLKKLMLIKFKSRTLTKPNIPSKRINYIKKILDNFKKRVDIIVIINKNYSIDIEFNSCNLKIINFIS